MPDPVIRAALDAAQRQASSFYSLAETADIIATFALALAEAKAPSAHSVWARGLAAAVEEAARHD